MRPAIEMNPARIAQDQYTKLYKDVLKKNNEIRACQDENDKARKLPELMREVAKIIDSEKAGKIRVKGS